MMATMALKIAVGHLAKGEWEKAHAIVQDDESALGCWAHGIVHLLEGDMDNAAYWYQRAGRPFPNKVDDITPALARRSGFKASPIC
jgi:hypothetical protein